VPNTLAQLNTFSNQSYTFEDQRDYAITFSANATSNQSVAVAEDVSFTSPVGINILSIISQPTPGNITYNINTSNISGNAILTWPTLPSTVSSSTPSLGVYRVTGYMDANIWNDIRNPTIIAKDQTANFVYSANIQYPSTANTANTNTWSWTNSVTISNTHSELSNATGFTYDEDVPKTIPGTPTITDTYAGPLPHTLVITPNVANAVFSLSMSANTSLNPVTKALTIVDTKANINTGLGNLWLIPGPDYDQTYSLNYSLTNPVSNLNTQVNQTATIGNTQTDFSMTTSYTYAEDAATQLVFALDDGDTTATSFTISVNQTLGTSGIFFVNGVNAGIGNLASFTGNRTAFNGANITFLPRPDTTDTINITANVFKINGVGNITVASNVVSTVTNTSSHAEYSLPSSFSENTRTSAIQITDTDPNATNYQMTVLQTAGNIGSWYVGNSYYSAANTLLSLSNSRANINSANVQFMPAITNTGNVQLTFNLSKTNTYFGNIVQAANVLANLAVVTTYPGIANMISRSYTSNTTNSIFANSTPALDDGPDYGQTYTITLTSAIGKFGNSQSNAISSASYSFTGNTTLVNSEFTNMKLVPNYGPFAGNGTFNYQQIRNDAGIGNTTIVNSTVTLTGTENALSPASYDYFTNTAVKTLTPTFSQYYWQRANVLIVGAGGGGGGQPTGPGASSGGAGGGGGGMVVEYTNTQLPAELHTMTIGQPGVAGSNGLSNYVGGTGGSTYYVNNSGTYLAYGGSGGGQTNDATPQWNQGGQSGNSISGAQGDGYAGGGGGGANVAGATGVGNGTAKVGGLGGAGWYSSITGSNVQYALGGQGGNYSANGASSTFGGGGGGAKFNLGTTGGGGAGGYIGITFK